MLPTDAETFARITDMRPVDPAEPRSSWLVTFEIKASANNTTIEVLAGAGDGYDATVQEAWEGLDAAISAMLEAVRAAKPTG